MKKMEEPDVEKQKKTAVQSAVSNMVFEVGCGGAIRHLADLGLTTKQIEERLKFPTSYENIEKTVFEQLIENGTLLTEEPGKCKKREKISYVQDRGKYGQITFRRVVEIVDDGAGSVAESKSRNGHMYGNENRDWQTDTFTGRDRERLEQLLNKKWKENGESPVYMSCDFGRGQEENGTDITVLNERQQEYIRGITWTRERMYHKLDHRMREILMRLVEKGQYQGNIYFTGSRVKVEIQ